LIVCPLPNDNIEECKNISTGKLPAPSLAKCKSITHKGFTSSETKEAKKLSESRTTLRNNSKTLERFENNFAWHFRREKSEMRF